ncbi:hypothetical protein G6L37_35085 [Agrobacterium rubi]|nr:hypothetical protein [Agrobacterium rubi]NTF23795.1 hypothetical protein [Agrobacterium rubi]
MKKPAMKPVEPLISRIKSAVPVGSTRLLSAVASDLRVSQKAVREEISGSYDGVCLNVGIRSGNGHAALPRAAWEVEHYEA